MKKLFLGLAAIVCFSLNLSAAETIEKNNEIEKTIQLCGVAVTFYDANGEVIDHRLYTSDQSTLEECKKYQNGVIADLVSQGYRVTKPVSTIGTAE